MCFKSYTEIELIKFTLRNGKHTLGYSMLVSAFLANSGGTSGANPYFKWVGFRKELQDYTKGAFNQVGTLSYYIIT